MLLEHLVEVKAESGRKRLVHRGETSWDWKKDPLGTFHIVIDIDKSEIKFLEKAIQNTNNIGAVQKSP